jgi:superfamily II DNA or RNA helicase
MQSVTLWIMDEAHHVLAGNKWGIAVGCFPQARGLGFTATACRNDGHGLGADTDGVFHDLLQTDGPRDLINRGYLTDYKIYAPLSDIKLHTVPISAATGDFNAPKLKIATRESHIVGDVIDKYVQYAKNKLDVVFATDCETAQNLADKFNASGIPAAMVHAETPDRERIAAIRKFKARRLLVLVNVDLFGEGFDLPAIEAVSMARPTKSYALFAQQFGRALRLLIAPTLMEVWDTFTDAQRRGYIAASGKPYGIIIDHVNNVLTHGLPDAPRWYSLERRERKAEADPDVIPLRTCPQCVRVYERFHAACPYCGFKPQPAERSGPEFVDGDLCELSPDVLAQLRGDIDRVDMSPHAYRVELARAHVPIIGQMANVKRHILKQEAQSILREALAWWAGHQRAQEMSDSESYKRFYFKFGTDVMSAQALGRNEALVLAEKIHSELEGMQKGR